MRAGLTRAPESDRLQKLSFNELYKIRGKAARYTLVPVDLAEQRRRQACGDGSLPMRI